MIIWINGTFGVGKTTTARAMCVDGDRRLFDPEYVGFMVAAQLRDHEVSDFQDLPPWRALVPVVAEQIHQFTQTDLVAVQSVLDEPCWQELVTGIESTGMSLVHVVLDCGEDELRRRIETDQEESQALEWRLDHIDRFHDAKAWLPAAADLVVDTTELGVDEVVAAIDRFLESRRAS